MAAETTVRSIVRKRIPPKLHIMPSPVFDLILSLHVTFCPGSSEDYDIDPQWIARARSACTPEMLETLAFFFGDGKGQWCSANLCGLIWQAPDPSNITATLDWLGIEASTEDVLIEVMKTEGLGDDWQEVALQIIRLQLDPNAASSDLSTRIQAFSRRFTAFERPAVVQFLTHPKEEIARMVDAMRFWYEHVFKQEEDRFTSIGRHEAARLEKRAAESSIDEVFASVIRGIEYNPPAAIANIVLAPSLIIMPSVFHFTAGDTLTYCYPLENPDHLAADTETTLRAEMIRLFDALADDTRIRILHHLTKRQMYLTELAEHLKLTKATTRHHMIRLRAAGLVTLHMQDHLSYYSLRTETLDEPTQLLRRYLDITQSQT